MTSTNRPAALIEAADNELASRLTLTRNRNSFTSSIKEKVLWN
jgi:hypothetical protein